MVEKVEKMVKEPSGADSILLEAQGLVYGDREDSYGHPLDDFSRTAKIWGAILGVAVTPEQVGLCMVGVKISRQCNRPKRDNMVDGAGYMETVQRVIDERYRREVLVGTTVCPMGHLL